MRQKKRKQIKERNKKREKLHKKTPQIPFPSPYFLPLSLSPSLTLLKGAPNLRRFANVMFGRQLLQWIADRGGGGRKGGGEKRGQGRKGGRGEKGEESPPSLLSPFYPMRRKRGGGGKGGGRVKKEKETGIERRKREGG